MPVSVRGIRGATTVETDSPDEIVTATEELLRAITEQNDLDAADIAWAFFTMTDDLASEFPALAARRLGWIDVPLMCGQELSIDAANPRSIPRCIRVTILVNTDRPRASIRPVYLRRATEIQSDLDRMRKEFGL
ncbi:MAG: chorismate mutase [Candidatus Dormibacteria bacterium]